MFLKDVDNNFLGFEGFASSEGFKSLAVALYTLTHVLLLFLSTMYEYGSSGTSLERNYLSITPITHIYEVSPEPSERETSIHILPTYVFDYIVTYIIRTLDKHIPVVGSLLVTHAAPHLYYLRSPVQ